MLKGEFRPIIKSNKHNKESSDTNGPVMGSSACLNFFFQNFRLSCLEWFNKMDSHQFSFHKKNNNLETVIVQEETALNYKKNVLTFTVQL